MRGYKIYIFVASVLVIFYFIAQINRPKAVDWSETLVNTDKIPFGTYVLYNRLNDIFPDANVQSFREPVYNVINDHNIDNGNYIIICNHINLNEYDYKKLIDFVKSGNDAFIASSYFSGIFDRDFKIKTAGELSEERIRFSNRSLDTGAYAFDRDISKGYFSRFDTTKAIVIGKNTQGHVNFIKYPVGKGAIFFNSNPLLFTNYSMLGNRGGNYVAIALSHLKKDKNLFWDEYYTLGRPGEENTMRVFLRYKQLRWAFYIAFFSLVAFVLYEIKRRQRVIPVIEPLSNSTLDFVNVVGQVYYEKRNNANIAQKKVLYLLAQLRDEYQLKTNKLDDEFTEKLTAKLGLETDFANELVNYLKFISVQDHVSDRELIELNKLIEQLYIQSR